MYEKFYRGGSCRIKAGVRLLLFLEQPSAQRWTKDAPVLDEKLKQHFPLCRFARLRTSLRACWRAVMSRVLIKIARDRTLFIRHKASVPRGREINFYKSVLERDLLKRQTLRSR